MELPTIAIAVAVAVAGAILVGAMSPGPSFVVVTQTAIARTRAHGLAAALGMGAGGALFATAALLGLHMLLTAVPWLYLSLKLTGGAYLVFLAVRIWKGAADPLPADGGTAASSHQKSFLLGLTTQLSNPKTAVVYASVFAALLPPDAPWWLTIVLVPLIFAIEAGWYALVALLLSSERPRHAYVRSKRHVDRATSGVMGLLGLQVITDSP